MDEQRTHIVTDVHGARIPERTIRSGLRLTMLTGAISMVWITVTLGMPLQMFFEALGATGFIIGLAGTLQQAAMVAQIPGAIITEKLSSRRVFVVTLIALQRILWVVPAFIVFFFPHGITAQVTLLILVGVSAFAGQCISASWFSWMADLIPPQLSGRYWGTRQMWTTSSMIVTLIIAGWFLDFMTGQGQQMMMYGFATVFLCAALFGIIDPLLYTRVPEPAMQRMNKETHFFSYAWELVTKRDFFFSSMAFGVWTFSIGLVGMFANIYLRRQCDVSYIHIATLVVSASLGGALASILWGHVIDRIGPRTAAAFVFLIAPYISFVWFFISPNTVALQLPFTSYAITLPQPVLLLIVANFFGGMIFSGSWLSQVNVMNNITTPAGRTFALALHWTLVGMIGMIGPLAGGYVMDYFVQNPLHVRLFMGANMDYIHVLVLIHVFISWGIALPLLLLVRRQHKELPFAHAASRMFATNPIRAIKSMYGIMVISSTQTRTEHTRAVQRLGRERASLAVQDLAERLDDPASDVREAAIDALGDIGNDAATDVLLEELQDDTCDLHPHILRALRRINPSHGLNILIEALYDTEKETRREAARALGVYGDQTAIEHLNAVLHMTNDISVKVAICEALGMLKKISSVYTIVPYLIASEQLKTRRTLVAAAGELLVTDEEFYLIYAKERNTRGEQAEKVMKRLRRAIRAHIPKQLQDIRKCIIPLTHEIYHEYEKDNFIRCCQLIYESGIRLAAYCEGKDSTRTPPLKLNEVVHIDPHFAAGMWYVQKIMSIEERIPLPSEVFLGMCFLRSWFVTHIKRKT